MNTPKVKSLRLWRKKSKLWLLAISLLTIGLWITTPPTAHAADKYVFVKVTDPSRIPAQLRDEPLSPLGIISVPVPENKEPAAYAEELRTKYHLAWAETDGTFRTHLTTPNDPYFDLQLGHEQLDLPSAWDSSQGSSDVRVGIIDTGIDGEHVDLAGRVAQGKNFLTGETIPANTNSDDNGHGTLIAGVVGAITNNNQGIAGVGWNATLVPLKVANAFGEASGSALAEALIYAADNGIKIVNMSLGSPGDFQIVEDAIIYAASRGVVMVGSSGNNGSIVNDPWSDCPSVCYPAAYEQVIAVGSVDENDTLSYFSNYGPELDLVAPGENILSTELWDHQSYTYASGTSLSSPYVTGTAVLFLARFPGVPPATLLTMLEKEADKPAGMNGDNFTNEYGFGRVNAAQAVGVHAEYYSQNAYPGTLYPGDSYQFEIRYRNTGQSTWRRGEFNLGTDHARDRTPVFTRGAGWISENRVQLVETTVGPNEIGTFRFTYTVPEGLAPGVYREHFRPVLDGVSWLDDYGIYWDVTVQNEASKYHAIWVNQNTYPSLVAGQSYQFELVLKNTGTITWQQETVRLGTSHPGDRTPVFTRGAGWISENRVAMVESAVAPDANATFQFTYTVPEGLPPGVYREYMQPVADGVTWMEDWGIYWDVQVLNPTPGYHAAWVGQNAYPSLSAGESYEFEVQFRNTGAETWQRGVANLGTSHPGDRTPVFTRGAGWISENRVQLVETTVGPNEIGTFRFTYTVPEGLAPGVYREYLQPVADGIAWMEDWGVYWDVTVN